MKIRWLIPIAGAVEHRTEGVEPGDIMEVPDLNGARYVVNGYAEEVGRKVKDASGEPLVERAAFIDNQPPPRPEPTEPVVGAGGDMGGEAEPEPHFPDKEWVEELPEPTRPPAEVEVVEAEPVKLVEPAPKKARTPRVPRRSK
jgi:hypothetical protein